MLNMKFQKGTRQVTRRYRITIVATAVTVVLCATLVVFYNKSQPHTASELVARYGPPLVVAKSASRESSSTAVTGGSAKDVRLEGIRFFQESDLSSNLVYIYSTSELVSLYVNDMVRQINGERPGDVFRFYLYDDAVIRVFIIDSNGVVIGRRQWSSQFITLSL